MCIRDRAVNNALGIFCRRQVGRLLGQIVMEALQDMQAIHLDNLGVVSDVEIVEEVLGGSQFVHCFG